LPRLFVADGPAKLCEMYAGLFGTAASSSARVGKRSSAKWFVLNPPIVVIQEPAGMPAARAA
jgi:hypothetical protein